MTGSKKATGNQGDTSSSTIPETGAQTGNQEAPESPLDTAAPIEPQPVSTFETGSSTDKNRKTVPSPE